MMLLLTRCGAVSVENSNIYLRAQPTNFIQGPDCFKVDVVRDHSSSKIYRDCMNAKAVKLNPHEAPLAKVKRHLKGQTSLETFYF